jgi:cytoskeletal protein CcmA (bactofilin family)
MPIFNKNDSAPTVKKEKLTPTPYPKEIRTILGENAHFNGVLSFEGAVRIDGNVKGEIISKGTLLVGEKSVIQAEIKAESIIVGGKICGNVTAVNRLELLSNAEICGNIQTPLLKIEEGAIFQGTSEMQKYDQETKSISYIKEKKVEKKKDYPIEKEENVKEKNNLG